MMDRNQDIKFTAFLRGKAMEAERAIRYRPTYFLGMLEDMGGYRTAVKLLSSKDVSEGFTKLFIGRRLDLTVEALVVESEWRQAFDPVLLTLAEKKLSAVGYRFTRRESQSPPEGENMQKSEAKHTDRMAKANRIVIYWPGGEEHIDVDIDKLGMQTEIAFTKQNYDDGGQADMYEVVSRISVSEGGRYLIEIDYVQALNPGIQNSWWGTTRIVLDKQTSNGVVSWSDFTDKTNDGTFDFRLIHAATAEHVECWADEDRALADRSDLDGTTKEVLRKERRGQRLFRERVLLREPSCRLTGVTNPAHLRASHIKPWAECQPDERMDPDNGLMLAPHVDHLFDRAYISFEDDGTLLIANDEVRQIMHLWRLDPGKEIQAQPFTVGQSAYLEHHRARLRDRATLDDAKTSSPLAVDLEWE